MPGTFDAPVDPLTGLAASACGVYVHFPFCLSKCPYCDFASVAAAQVPHERYARAVVAELARRSGGAPRPVHSVYLGGGTPSLWAPACVGEVLDAVARHFALSPGCEVTLEANPGAADASRFRGYRAAGVNRLSLGVQSFDAATLRALGRSHDAEAARSAFRAARSAGLENVSMDFIYGVFGQSVHGARDDADQAVALGPEHLSAYALTLDRELLAEEVPLARQFARGEVVLPDDDVVLAMADAVGERYAQAGLRQYEISNYAREGFHSRHNALYWTGGEYLAVGVGATGLLRTGPTTAERYQNHRSWEKYLGAVEQGFLPEASRERLGSAELLAERLAMGLRLVGGVDVEGACGSMGIDARSRLAEVERWIAAGWARRDGRRVALTAAGRNLHSELAARVL